MYKIRKVGKPVSDFLAEFALASNLFMKVIS